MFQAQTLTAQDNQFHFLRDTFYVGNPNHLGLPCYISIENKPQKISLPLALEILVAGFY